MQGGETCCVVAGTPLDGVAPKLSIARKAPTEQSVKVCHDTVPWLISFSLGLCSAIANRFQDNPVAIRLRT